MSDDLPGARDRNARVVFRFPGEALGFEADFQCIGRLPDDGKQQGIIARGADDVIRGCAIVVVG